MLLSRILIERVLRNINYSKFYKHILITELLFEISLSFYDIHVRVLLNARAHLQGF